jgi:predicted PurR-regulated permease PerM
MLAELPAAPWFRRIVVAAVLLGVLLLTYMVLAPFVVPLIWAAILAYVTWPLHIRVSRLMPRKQSLASLTTTLLVSFAIVLPIVWLVFMFKTETVTAYREVQNFLLNKPILPPALRDLPGVGPWLQERWADLTADPTALKTELQQLIARSTDELSTVMGGVGRNIGKLFVALFAMFFFLRDGPRFFVQMRGVLEGVLGPRVRDYLKAIGDTTQAVVYALVVAALTQGIAAGVGYWAAGVEAPVLLGAITALTALIPFGAPLIWGALSAWLLVTGHVWAGAGLALWGIAIVSWVDNVVRPLVISNATQMPFILVVLGVLGGVLSFGLIGLFIGPVVLAVSLAIWREWLEHRRQELQRT